jgi:hypothetical protein
VAVRADDHRSTHDAPATAKPPEDATSDLALDDDRQRRDDDEGSEPVRDLELEQVRENDEQDRPERDRLDHPRELVTPEGDASGLVGALLGQEEQGGDRQHRTDSEWTIPRAVVDTRQDGNDDDRDQHRQDDGSGVSCDQKGLPAVEASARAVR